MILEIYINPKFEYYGMSSTLFSLFFFYELIVLFLVSCGALSTALGFEICLGFNTTRGNRLRICAQSSS